MRPLSLTLALSLASPLALAQPAPPRCSPEDTRAVEALGRRAVTAREEGQHARAAELTRAALALCPSPSLWYFAAYEERAAGELEPAAEHLAACVRAVGFDPLRRDLAVECRTLAERVAEDARRTAPELAPPPPVEPQPRPAPPGPRESSNSPQVEPLPAPRPPPARPAPQGPGVGPWALVGAGGAALVTYGVLAALRAASLSGCALEAGAAVCDTPQDTARAGDAAGLSTAGNVALGVGIAALVGGLAWWTVGTLARGRDEGPVRVSLGAAGVGVRW